MKPKSLLGLLIVVMLGSPLSTSIAGTNTPNKVDIPDKIDIQSKEGGDERIRLHYHERPPYMVTVARGVVTGLTATKTSLAFQYAGIPHFWEKTPSKRQMRILEKNESKDCLVGWFKNPAREKIAKFTKPIYRDKPAIGLALFSNENIESGRTLMDVLQDKNIKLLTKKGYSYGKFIDDLINEVDPDRLKVTVENTSMIRMLNAGRADYIFMAEEEANGLIKNARFSKGDFKFIRFQDVPAGNERYIMCSKKVENEVIEELDHWIGILSD